MAELTKNQKRALVVFKTAWQLRQQNLDAEAQAAENARAERINKARGLRALDAGAEVASRLPTFRERADVDAAFDEGLSAVLRFERGRIKDPDIIDTVTGEVLEEGEVHEVTFVRPDADSIGAKMIELRAALPADKVALWDEVFGE